MDSNQLFEQTKPIKLFFMAAVPGTLGMLAGSLYGLLEGIFVGQILGETAFAALNLAFPFVFINFSLADLIGVGSSVPISISLGQKKSKEADNFFTCACIMIIAAGVMMGTLLYLGAPVFIGMLGAEGELKDLAVSYMRVYALFSPVTTLIFAMDNYWKICGRIRGSMYLNIFMSILSALFIFLGLVVFRLGLVGSALGNCLSLSICVVLAAAPFLRGKETLRFRRPAFSISLIRRVINTGMPTFLNNVAGRLTSIIMNRVLILLGGAGAVAVYGVLMYVGDFIQMILYGVCDSLQPAIGYNWGAGNLKRVKEIGKYCFIGSGVVSLFSFLASFFFPETITGLFIHSEGTAATAASAAALVIFSFTFITRWFGFSAQSFLIAINKSFPATILSLSNALIVPVALILLFWPLGLTGLWLNFPVTSLIIALLALFLLKKGLGERKYRELKRRV